MKRQFFYLSAVCILSVVLLAGCLYNGSSGGTDGSGAASGTETGLLANAGSPTREIKGIVQWGEGGGTDSLMRPLAALAQEYLGKNIVVQNMTGGTGSIAAQYVYDQDADGYNLLMGAENPCLYDTLNILNLTYDNFECIILIGDETVGIAVGKDSPYHSIRELCEAANAGEEVTMATTGTGGLPWEVGALVSSVTGATFTQVQYDADSSALAAVLSGECDFTVCKVQSGLEEYRAGNLRMLCMLSMETVDQMPDVPLITEEYPDFSEYLPWGPFYGVFVKEGTDQTIVDTLSEAFQQAFHEDSYQKVLEDYNINPMGYTGTAAKEYLSSWKANTVDALTKVGIAAAS